MKYVIANWKANMGPSEAKAWCDDFSSKLMAGSKLNAMFEEGKLTVIVCPPFPLIPLVKEALPQIKNLYIGCQDISMFEKGSYTGEVTAASVSGMSKYAIIGHSERRQHFNETEEQIALKIGNAMKAAIEPVLCIRGVNDTVHEYAQYIAYEPVDSIGSGNNASLDLVLGVKQKMGIHAPKAFLYGGSVNDANCKVYLDSPEIDGLLIGSASLDSKMFHSIITQVT